MKKQNFLIWLPLVFSLLGGIYACSHGPSIKEQVETEAKQETPNPMGGVSAARGLEVIQNAKNLSQEQKDKLSLLSQKIAQEMGTIRNEESQLKMVLFKTLVDPGSDSRKITVIKNKIIKLERLKTDKMLGALGEAQKILGRKSPQDEEVYQSLLLERAEGF